MGDCELEDDRALLAVDALVVIVRYFDDLVVEDGSELIEERDSCDCESDKLLEVFWIEDWEFGTNLKFKRQ